MFGTSVRWSCKGATALAAATLLAGCALGPDFLHPAAPKIGGYTAEPLAAATPATDLPTGAAQRFVQGRDIPQEWWALFRSPALNALIRRSLDNNPSLQSAIATLRAANQAVYAQQGRFFPQAQANFNPTRQQISSSLSPIISSTTNPYNLYTAQVLVSYTFDIWGLNRRTVESLQAQADMQRFQVEAAYLTLASNVAVAAITEASLRGQIEATNELITINGKMLDILRRQLDAGYANRSDVAAQEAALAQARATLPPLRKALQQQRDLLAALAGGFPSEGPRETFRLADLQLPGDLPVTLPSQLIEQRPDIRAAERTALRKRTDRCRHREPASQFQHQRQCRLHEYRPCRISHRRTCFGRLRVMLPRHCLTAARFCTSSSRPRTLTTRRPGLTGAPSSPPCKTSPTRCAPCKTTRMR